MASRNILGKLFQSRNEVRLKWKLADFSTLSKEPDVCYHSQYFVFSDARWLLKIFPNGLSKHRSEGYVGLYVWKEDGPRLSVTYSLGLKKADGTKGLVLQSRKVFENEKGWGSAECIRRSEVMERKTELLPSDVLTVLCTLKFEYLSLVEASMFEGLMNLSFSMKSMLTEGVGSDVVLKLKGRELKAHRMVLENRSRVFAAMLSHDMSENRTGEIAIDDIDAGVFQEVLNYMYCGRLDELTDENVRQIYTAADKYDLGELKKMCTTYMEQNMSHGLFCDALLVADTFGEEELKRVAKRYFSVFPVNVLETDEWKRLELENGAVALHFLVSFVKGSVCK